MKKGLLIIISGPSGAGKGTIYEAVLGNNPNISKSISVTTRLPRHTERDGVDYHFITKKQFFELKDSGALLENAKVYGNYYGTPVGPIIDKIDNGMDVMFEIDIAGARQIKSKYPHAITIFVIPPTLEILERRLRLRGTDSDDIIAMRLAATRSEIAFNDMFDYFVLNDIVKTSVEAVQDIIKAERHKTHLFGDFINKTYLGK